MAWVKRQWIILLAMTTTLAILLLDSHAWPVALPMIQDCFGFNETQQVWIMNAHCLGTAAFILLGGRITDLFGSRKVYIISSFFYMAISLATGLAYLGWLFILFRFFQGAIIGFMIPSALAILMQTFKQENRGRALGVSVAMSTLILYTGPILIGWILQNTSWRVIVLPSLFLCLVGLLGAFFTLSNSKPSEKKEIDYVGAISLSFFLIFGVMAIMQWKKGGLVGSPFSVGCFFLALLFGFFLFRSSKNKQFPIIDYELFSNKEFLYCLTVIFITQLIVPLPVYWVKYMQEVIGMSPLQTGQITGYSMMPVFFAAPFAGYLSDKFFPKLPVSLGFISVIMATLFFNQFMQHQELFYIYLAFSFFSVGNALILTPAGAATLSHPTSGSRGSAAGMYNTVRFLGVSVGLAVFGLLHYFVCEGQLELKKPCIEALLYDHFIVFFLATVGALLTLVHLNSYNEVQVET